MKLLRWMNMIKCRIRKMSEYCEKLEAASMNNKLQDNCFRKYEDRKKLLCWFGVMGLQLKQLFGRSVKEGIIAANLNRE